MNKSKFLFTETPELITDSEYMVHIDCGHGGIIDGVYDTAPAKMYDHGEFVFYEGAFNRRIGLLYAYMLTEIGISHCFITDSNYDVALNIRTTRSNNLLRLYPKKKHFYLSIHGNAAPKGAESATGIEVYTSVGDTPADPMADIFYKYLELMGWKMRKDTVDGDFDKEALFYVLTHTKVPAILVELGFYTNLVEAKKMSDPGVQLKLASLLFDATKQIIKND